MLLFLLRPLDLLWDGFQHRRINICIYVDDIALHATGTETSVAASIAVASDQLISELESTLSMVVSRRAPWATDGVAESVATVGSQRLASRISTSMRRLGIAI